LVEFSKIHLRGMNLFISIKNSENVEELKKNLIAVAVVKINKFKIN
jgi:hypothetical protein